MRSATLCASLAIAALACKSGDSSDRPAGSATPPATGEAAGTSASGATKPPPPATALVGKARLVNLHLDKDGKAQPVEVWSQETAQYAAARIAGPVELGAATDWFGVPRAGRALILPVGADPTQLQRMLGRMPTLAEGDQVTVALFASKAGPSIQALWDARADGKLAALAGPPAAGKALITLVTLGVEPHRQALDGGVGSRFFLGTGRGECVAQRVEREGLLGQIIGSGSPAYVEVAPGKTTFTLHAWPSRVSCDSEPKMSFDVEVAADQRSLVLLYTPDGKSLSTISL